MKKLGWVFVVIVISLLFFYPTITKGLLPVPSDTLSGLYYPWFQKTPFKNYLITDPIRQQIPWRKLAVDSLKSGHLPAWDLNNFLGTPLTANVQAGTFYPLNILFFLLPFPVAWAALIISQPILAGLFLFLYLRDKKIIPAVCALAAVVFAFSGFSIAWLTWGTIVSTILWLPLILLAIDKLYQGERPIVWSLALIASTASGFFAGHAQVALYMFIFAGIYACFRFSWWLLAVAVLAVGITAIQWVPFTQFLANTSRFADTMAWLKDGWFLPWQNLIQFVAPDFFGNPSTLNYWGIWNYGEFIGYIGIVPLMLAIHAVIARKDRLTRFFAIATGVVLLFLLPTPIAQLPYQWHIPILFSLQPTRLIVLVDVSLAVLVALGLDIFLRKPDKKIIISITLVGMILAGLWVYVLYNIRGAGSLDIVSNLTVAKRNLMLPSILWFVGSWLLVSFLFFKKQWVTILLLITIMFVTVDLFRFGWKFTPFTAPTLFFPTTPTITFLQHQQGPFRVVSLDNRIFPPNVTSYYNIETPEGYDPLYSARYEEFIAALNRGAPNIAPPFGFNRIITISRLNSPLLPLLNVKYILSINPIMSPDVELMYSDGETHIYWYKRGLPRMFAVESVVSATSRQSVMDALFKQSFHPAAIAVLERPLQVTKSMVTDADSIAIHSDTSATISFTSPHFVVISNMYDKGWKAFVDDKEVTIYRTDYILQGVLVPAGRHELKLTYN